MINHEMVVLAREYRNLTQEELARKIQVSQGSISKIEGGVAPDRAEELIARIANALEFPVEFFRQPGERLGFGSSSYYYRKRAAISAADRKRISGLVNLLRLMLKRLLTAVELEANRRLPEFSLDDFNCAASIARALRSAWNLPEGPIGNLTALLESAGVVIIPCDFGTSAMDATSLRLSDMPPLIFISKSIPTDRWRFTLAHELCHLVAHFSPSETMEDEADQFAAEFLTPAAALSAQFRRYPRLRLQDLANLKPYWKVSMASLLYRASDVGAISKAKAKSLWVQLGPFRKNEPNPLPAEKTQNFDNLFSYYIKELSYSGAELAQLLLMFPSEFSRLGVEVAPQKARPALRVVAGPNES